MWIHVIFVIPDDCASLPCLNGGQCVDAVNNYSCHSCLSGFEGRNCEERSDVCLGQNCNSSGQCLDDYVNNRHLCICEDGYEPTGKFLLKPSVKVLL